MVFNHILLSVLLSASICNEMTLNYNEINHTKENVIFVESVDEDSKGITVTIRLNDESYDIDTIKSKLNKYDLNFDISGCAPFAFLYFNDFSSYISSKEDIVMLSQKEFVNSIFVESFTIEPAATANNGYSLENIDMTKAKEMVGTTNAIYTGVGIKVGMVDSGAIQNFNNFNNIYINDSLSDSDYSLHSTRVASIISGTYGLATSCDLYVSSYAHGNQTYTLKKAVEGLLSKEVDVINLSITTDGNYETSGNHNYGYCDGFSLYLDYISWYHNIPLVVAVGNKDPEYSSTTKVHNPAMGLNSVSVGSVDIDKNVSWFSNYEVNENLHDVLVKPLLVAPGENIVIPNTGDVPISGTSFAAPMVTGVIALLMQEFPQLKKKPEVIISALMASANKLPTQNNLIDNRAGCGIINYEEARKILSSNSYLYTTVNSTTSDVIMETVITDVEDYLVEFSFINLVNSNVLTPTTNTYIPSFTNYYIEVYDEDDNLIDFVNYESKSNIIVGEFIADDYFDEYRIVVKMDGNKVGSSEEKLGLSLKYTHLEHDYSEHYDYVSNEYHNAFCECGEYEEEDHSFGVDYASYSNSYHKSLCICGYYELESHNFSGPYTWYSRTQHSTICTICHISYFLPHAVKSGQNRCLLCGGIADVGLIGPSGFTMRTNCSNIINSIILDNGVLVLAEEDVKEFLNDPIDFYDKVNEKQKL